MKRSALFFASALILAAPAAMAQDSSLVDVDLGLGGDEGAAREGCGQRRFVGL